MPFAAGVKFSKDDFSKYYHPGDLKLAVDDFCVARDSFLNVERVGFVSILEGRAPIQMDHLPKIVRLATESEVEQWYDLKIREKEAVRVAAERAAAQNLEIKISGATFVPEKAQMMIHFTAEKRVDFRELVKDLGGQFKARIEMWQIGARQEAAVKGGIGICGRELCCSSWLKDYPSITMRHAKEQDIVQPPSKLSGNCGRLRCCLRYEHEQYIALAVGAPALGCAGRCTFAARGWVVERNLLKGEVKVKDENGETAVMPFSDFTPDPNQKTAPQRPSKNAIAEADEDDRETTDD